MLAAFLQLTAFAVVAIATARPGLRRPGAAALVAVAALAIGLATSHQGPRSLDITHQFTAYVGLTVQAKDFPVETLRDVPAAYWGLLLAGFCLAWAAWLYFLAKRPQGRTFGGPVILAWSGCALQLCMEKAAGPIELFAPFDLAPDRALLPATLAGAYLLAQRGGKILPMVLYLSLFVAVTRLPLAVFGTLASQNSWGTHLDVHTATYFVPPGSNGIGIEAQAGDSQQLFWMVWAPHLVVLPALYMMSTGGLAFLSLMWQRQQQEDQRGNS